MGCETRVRMRIVCIHPAIAQYSRLLETSVVAQAKAGPLRAGQAGRWCRKGTLRGCEGAHGRRHDGGASTTGLSRERPQRVNRSRRNDTASGAGRCLERVGPHDAVIGLEELAAMLHENVGQWVIRGSENRRRGCGCRPRSRGLCGVAHQLLLRVVELRPRHGGEGGLEWRRVLHKGVEGCCWGEAFSLFSPILVDRAARHRRRRSCEGRLSRRGRRQRKGVRGHGQQEVCDGQEEKKEEHVFIRCLLVQEYSVILTRRPLCQTMSS